VVFLSDELFVQSVQNRLVGSRCAWAFVDLVLEDKLPPGLLLDGVAEEHTPFENGELVTCGQVPTKTAVQR
jgi:hypothetical protein